MSFSITYSYSSCITHFDVVDTLYTLVGSHVLVVSWLYTTFVPRMQALPAIVAFDMWAWSHVLYPEYFGFAISTGLP